MKCTNKIRLLCLISVAAVFMSGCGSEVASITNPYQVYSTTAQNCISGTNDDSELRYFSDDLCVSDDISLGLEQTTSQVAEGAGVFNLATNTVSYAKNIYEKLYPASTTKILTAYLAIKYGNLDDYVTVSENAVTTTDDSSVCGLKAGDIISLRDLLYGMMLRSGNDAAIAIAEYISGDVASFSELMNQEANAMGATQSHFVNPNGLPDEDHYTSVYDLYLLMQNAIKDETFIEVIKAVQYNAVYTDANGNEVNVTWDNTNRYLSGKQTAPEGITVIGGKTGTTGDAGYCLVLYSMNAQNQPIISVVLKSDARSNLYLLMNEMLSGFAN